MEAESGERGCRLAGEHEEKNVDISAIVVLSVAKNLSRCYEDSSLCSELPRPNSTEVGAAS
jgi:hypothetical protein